MKREKGITLITLVITIVVLLILAGAGIYFGTDAIQSAKLTTFTTEMEMMQSEVNNLAQKKQSGDNSVDDIGKNLTDSQEEQDAFEAAGVTNKSGYRYYDQETIKQLDLEGINQEFLVNVSKYDVISLEGLKYQGNIYYRLSDLPNSMYTVDYVNKNTGGVSFDVNVEPLASSWVIEAVNIQNSGEYVKKSEVYYQKMPDPGYWNKADGNSFEVKEAGIYNIKVKDATGKEAIKTQYIYNKDGMIMYLDGENNTGAGHSSTTTTWKDLSGNGNDGTLKNFENTTGSGWQSNGLQFDGVDSYVEILNSQNLFNADESFTMTIVAESESYLVGKALISKSTKQDAIYTGKGIGITNISNPRRVYLNITSDTNTYKMVGFNTPLEYFGKSTLTFVKDQDNLIAYRNGISQGSLEVPTNYGSINALNNILIGYGNNIKAYSVRIYDRALTPTEVQQNYDVDEIHFQS